MTVVRLVGLAFALLLAASPAVSTQQATTYIGFVPGGARYLIDVPAHWNGTLLLYSHGYVERDAENVPFDAPGAAVKTWLLVHGFALAASGYATTGWAVSDALGDQIATLDAFAARTGKRAQHTIAWGHSMGGLITAALVERYPNRFDGALPMCGVVAGATPYFNNVAVGLSAFRTLLTGANALDFTPVVDPQIAANRAVEVLAHAQTSAAGRARVALVSDLLLLPHWWGTFNPEPVAADRRELADAQALTYIRIARFSFDAIAEVEQRLHGIPFTTTGASFAQQFASSQNRSEVAALYRRAGLDLGADLRALDAAPPISADAHAAAALAASGDLTGDINVPILTLHTIGDPLVAVANEHAYHSQIERAGKAALLRQTFVHRAGHCEFTGAETLAALQSLTARLDTGIWPNISPHALNAAAIALGPMLNALADEKAALRPVSPAFAAYSPPAFPGT